MSIARYVLVTVSTLFSDLYGKKIDSPYAFEMLFDVLLYLTALRSVSARSLPLSVSVSFAKWMKSIWSMPVLLANSRLEPLAVATVL